MISKSAAIEVNNKLSRLFWIINTLIMCNLSLKGELYTIELYAFKPI